MVGVVLIVAIGFGPVVTRCLQLVASIIYRQPQQVNLSEPAIRPISLRMHMVKRAILVHILHDGPLGALIIQIVIEGFFPLILPPDTSEILLLEVSGGYV